MHCLSAMHRTPTPACHRNSGATPALSPTRLTGSTFPCRGLVIALATALQESGLRNLDYGDRDSLGLFQQRPSMGWGTPTQVTDPAYAAHAFFTGAGTNPGLLDISHWEALPLWLAADSVQHSAYPIAYADHEAEATGDRGGNRRRPLW